MDGLTFATDIFGRSWSSYLQEYSLDTSFDNWLSKTITQAFDSLEIVEKEILQGIFSNAFTGKVSRLQEWLFDAILAPFLEQRLSVFTTKGIFKDLITFRKEQIGAYQAELAKDIFAQTISTIDASIIEVSTESQRINYERNENINEGLETGIHEEESWKLGYKYKERLNLTTRETSWLNKFWNPDNAFLAIDGCCIATIKLYLLCLKRMNSVFERKGTTISKQVKQFMELFVKPVVTDIYGVSYEQKNLESQIYLTIFKRSENIVREIFQHKRKINIVFTYKDVAADFEQIFGEPATGIINEIRHTIELPDTETEILLNEMNVTRWKVYFDQITIALNEENFGERILMIDQLGIMNEKNPALENIYYEASKAFTKFDRLTAIRFYLKYIYADIYSEKIDNRQLSKTIQKSIFSTKEQLALFEDIANELIKTRDLPKALAEVPKIYEKKRKKITIDEVAVTAVINQNRETVERLSEILQEEDIPASLAVRENYLMEEITIQLTAVERQEHGSSEIVFLSGLNLNENQRELLTLFKESNYCLSTDQVNRYAKDKHLFKNQLIESINDCCYEQLDDLLIEEGEDKYEINEFYYQKIINLC